MKALASRNYLLAVLMIIMAFNQVDRLALGLLLQDIKIELDLSDTQLGFLTGIAFALFYSVMGLPIARWADRGNRVLIISIATLLWSVMVALCGAARSFPQLALIRVGVAVGEAGCMPPAHSLIADYFTRDERPRAVAIYMLGVPLSVVIGYFAAGWLNEFYGWRATLVILGLPGVVLAALAWFTLREPRTERPPNTIAPEQPGAKEVCATLWANVTFRHLLLFFSIVSLFGYGLQQWMPAFFVRTHGLNSGELGTWLAVIYGAAGLLGTYWGGAWASGSAARNERLQLGVGSLVYCGFGIISIFVYLSPDYRVALVLLGIGALGGAATIGALFATIQTIVPERMRAVSIAIVYLFANLIGMGLGPLLAGALSDLLRPSLGEESLRYALLALCPGYVWGAWHLRQASKAVTRDLELSQAARCSS
jgi:MFS transporter, Spinster family, sphingosine-1-phosphate transporter